MKILSLANEIRNDVTTSGVKIKRATTTGYNIASRNAQIYKHGNLRKGINIARSIGDKIIKGTSRKELPYIAGAIGMFIPFPLACPILMGLGFLFLGLSNLYLKSTKSEPNNKQLLDTNV